jgi:hypothetical protein
MRLIQTGIENINDQGRVYQAAHGLKVENRAVSENVDFQVYKWMTKAEYQATK